MIKHLRMMLSLLPFIIGEIVPPTPPAPTPPAPKPDDDTKVTFTEEQQAALNRIVAAEKQKAADKARADRDAEIAAEKAAADAEAKRQRDEEAGNFDKVKTDLITERDTAKADLAAVVKERDDLLALVKVDVEAAWETVPAEVREAYTGDDNDVMARKDHMQRMKKIIDRLGGTGGGGNPQPPKPDNGSFDLEAERQKAAAQVASKF